MSVVTVVLATYLPAERMTARIVDREDSFNAHIIVNILCTVLMMSVLLTVIGTWIGTGAITMAPIEQFFYKWPRNFAVSFAVELCTRAAYRTIGDAKAASLSDNRVRA